MLKATDTYAFYQAKSIKQTIAEGQRDEYAARGDRAKVAKLEEKIARYETDPVKGEGKKRIASQGTSV
jgi:hypothetical protein